MRLKDKLIFLKKSYKVRNILDIFMNSKYIILLHVEEFGKYAFIRKKLKEKNINMRFINKDEIFLKRFKIYAKGPSLLLYNEIFFLEILENLFEQNNLKFNIILFKYLNFIDFKLFRSEQKNYNFFKNKNKILEKYFYIFIQYRNILKLIFYIILNLFLKIYQNFDKFLKINLKLYKILIYKKNDNL